jgi:two-component system sensor histidine kinase DesK
MITIPSEIKLTFLLAFGITILLVGFVVFILSVYNKKQQILVKEKQLAEEKIKNQALEKELEIQKSLQTERDRISFDMHDELGAGISAIKLQSEILKQQVDKNNLQHDDINEIIRISEDMKGAMREMLWSLNSKNDYVSKFISYLQIYIENYLSKAQIKIQFNTQSIKDDLIINSENRRNILMIIKEICHNITKHSQAKEVRIDCKSSENTLQITISDDGIGFNINTQSNGYGISTMQSRVGTMQGEIKFQSSPTGTNIDLQVPI